MLEDMSNSPSTSRRRSKPSQENWDDDFEFTLPTRKSTNNTTKTSYGKEKDENVPLSRVDSLTEDWDENWDESPPRSNLPQPGLTAKHERKKSSIPPPINIPSSSSSHRMNPPRLSPSHSAGLSISPLLTSFSSAQQPLLPSRSYSSLSMGPSPSNLQHQQSQHLPRMRSGSTTTSTVSRNKLIKRHPSTSFVPIPNSHSSSNLALNSAQPNPSEASLNSISTTNRSSPYLPQNSPSLPRSTSGEQMPPPPLPQGGFLGRSRSRSKSKSKAGQEVRVSNIPFSPSRDDMREKEKEKEKRPGFWKRLSGAPSVGEKYEGVPQHRRRRSSSVGAKHPPSGSPRPPVPPLPTNLRSPSGASSTSTSSAKSGPTSAFSALLRRSSSSSSKRSDKSKDTPPSSYPYSSSKHGVSSSSVNSCRQQPVSIPANRKGDVTPDLPSSASVSIGFHLPSPSPSSPYHPSKSRVTSAAQQYFDLPPLPHSTSFPGPQLGQKGSGSDTETEGDSKTPKRRKKMRPVSALPAPRSHHGQGEPIPGLPISRQTSIGEFHTSKSSDSPASPFAQGTTSTLKRLGSLSKKHGRRLSGGWKFGTNSSNDSNKSAIRPLEPVLGSPSKPNRNDDELPLSPISPTPNPESEEELRKAIRAGSVSAPTSMFTQPRQALDPQDVGESPSEEVVEKEKKEKHQRRQSWNDFVIPREVMMKQKELKERIGAVKMFAGGVATLKTLLSTHADIRDRILSSGSTTDAANFASLDLEFEQWLEMAVVLIEVGSTGADPSTQASFSSPPRSRRVTLASDEAKAASAAMSKATSAPGGPIPPVQLSSWRKASLPDPEETNFNMMGPPRAEFPEQWRASTGRQDLSKRQLEVLRTMLRTPMSANTPDKNRPGMGPRTASTLSASSTSSYLQAQGSPSPNSKGQSHTQRGVTPTPDSGSISFPSPGDSAHIQPSNSFPSPLSAARMNHNQRGLKDRRASKAGLAGLKEFLRSLKKDKSTSSVPQSAGLPEGGGGLSPLRIKSRFGFKNSTSPPASPTSPLSPSFSPNGNNDVFYPTQRSSFSALGAASGAIPQTPQTAQPVLTSRSRAGTESSFNRGGLGSEQKRPSIRNIFRTSSGNWSELVKNDPSFSPGAGSSSNASSPGSTKGVSGLSKKLSAQRLGFSSSKSSNKISVSDPIPSKLPLSTSSRTLTGGDHMPSELKEKEGEMTLRPTAKKRVSGLGLGLGWPEANPSSNDPGSPVKISHGIGEMGTVYESPSKLDEERTVKHRGNPTSPSKIRFPSNKTFTSSISTNSSGRVSSNGIGSTTSSRVPSNDIYPSDMGMRTSEDSTFTNDLTIALTPENLPTLLEYLRQCERMLGVWRERVGEVIRVEVEGDGVKV
ncbi:hypothetical protein I302_104373 [Kwoniella bestiolae CBS 10118]|uniref:Uncharacterized protein n=1 Tax=Kwoniella bestiolae CBS 10118 TaxID=1296100 RepID=A0A1B9GB25_9TREE|nr:hypothetical protein I302_03081 [Kwoniella bestiolae CBS 10118]OCF28229.1 hypothetical protein I302_03081 [Kwoniella bestiolae CBS 10118]